MVILPSFISSRKQKNIISAICLVLELYVLFPII